MRPISSKNRKIISDDPYYQKCARGRWGGCSGRVTIHHAFIYAGRQIDDLWNLVPLCEYHHLGKGFDKSIGEFLALTRATYSDLIKYPKKDWAGIIHWLKLKCGKLFEEDDNKTSSL